MEFFFMVFCKQLELPKRSLTRRGGRREYAGEAFAEQRRSGRGFACKPQRAQNVFDQSVVVELYKAKLTKQEYAEKLSPQSY